MSVKAILIVAAAVLLATGVAAVYFVPPIAGMVCDVLGCGESSGTTSSLSGALCTKAAATGCADAVDLADLSEDERRIAEYVADRIVEDGTIAFSDEDLEGATGVDLEGVREPVLQAAVIALLGRRGFDLATLSGGGYCSKFSACSVDRNLNNASGAELARYREESSADGQTFEDWIAPAFELPNTEGDTVALSDFRGKNVALVFLSGHCYHSLDTLPIIAELRDEYADRNVEIIPVFINSGSIEDLRSRAWEWDVGYPLIVSEDKSISRAYDTRMVPSTFLIDEQGRVTKRLVGFKDLAALDAALEELARS